MVKPVLDFIAANAPKSRVVTEGLTAAKDVAMPRMGFVRSVVSYFTHVPANEGKALLPNPLERLF